MKRPVFYNRIYVLLMSVVTRTWGSPNDVNTCCNHVEYDTMSIGEFLPTFRRILVPPSS